MKSPNLCRFGDLKAFYCLPWKSYWDDDDDDDVVVVVADVFVCLYVCTYVRT